jgi:hypothetical protein
LDCETIFLEQCATGRRHPLNRVPIDLSAVHSDLAVCAIGEEHSATIVVPKHELADPKSGRPCADKYGACAVAKNDAIPIFWINHTRHGLGAADKHVPSSPALHQRRGT